MQPFVCPRCSHESTYDPWIESARCPVCGYEPRPGGSAPPLQTTIDSVDRANQLILNGQPEEAKRLLGELLRVNPDHILGWDLLSRVIDDPAKQADCYRQILRIDPDNSNAAKALRRLTGAPPVAQTTEEALRCPGCNAPIEVRFVGELRDKRAVCPYCGLDTDLPDTYQRIERQRTHERHNWGSRTVDTVVVQGRADLSNLPASQEQAIHSLEAEMQQIIDATAAGDVVRDHRSAPSAIEPSKSRRRGRRRLFPSLLQRIIDNQAREAGLVDEQEPEPPRELSTEEVIRLAGGPLPVEERRQCPQCQATISKTAAWCQWCGARFSSETDR